MGNADSVHDVEMSSLSVASSNDRSRIRVNNSSREIFIRRPIKIDPYECRFRSSDLCSGFAPFLRLISNVGSSIKVVARKPFLDRFVDPLAFVFD